jgi:hypothetical protein
MRRTYVRRSEHEMKRNAEIGLFTKPSNVRDSKTHNFKVFRNTSWIIDEGLRHVLHQRPLRIMIRIESTSLTTL